MRKQIQTVALAAAASLGSAVLLIALAGPARAAEIAVRPSPGDGFVVLNFPGTIERLRVDEDTGNVSRNGALFVHTTGTLNTFVGVSAGSLATSGLGRNSGFGEQALANLQSGQQNSAFGHYALRLNTHGSFNSAFGQEALLANTNSHYNSAFGHYALRSNDGTGNSAFGQQALRLNATGAHNSAFGRDALRANTTSDNSAFGSFALTSNDSGEHNSAFGKDALRSNITGSNNSAFGFHALFSNTSLNNTAFGSNALASTTTAGANTAVGTSALTNNQYGGGNVAVGFSALSSNTHGSGNIAIGELAGSGLTTGSDNIYIGTGALAVDESGEIRIGKNGTHTNTWIQGIHGGTTPGGIAVLVNAAGVLGTTTSSARFKQDVRDMGEASDLLMKLHPVVFRYREEVGEGNDLEYGLIAEEVAQVAPELVAPDLEGKPYSVRYHVLPALLLNEVQEQQRTIETLQARIGELERRLVAEAKEGIR